MKRQHIDTDNYEEYFLLYVDNELTEAERQSVQAFIAQHPELKDELQGYLDTRLDMEETAFEGKELLFRMKSGVNAENIEELQVLLVDNELDQETAAEVMAYTSASPVAAENFEWLKKAKLVPENISFPDKSILFRSERKPAILISVQWFRIAAAAAVLLIAGLLWLNRSDERATGVNIASVEDARTNEQIAVKDGTKEIPDVAAITSTTEETGNDGNKALTEEKINSSNKGSVEPVIVRKDMRKQEQGTSVNYAAVTDNGVNRSGSVMETSVTKGETNSAKFDVKAPDIVESRVIHAPDAVPTQALAMNVRTDYVSEAIYDDNISQEETGYEEQKPRKGLRGIVRKANRIYNKVTNPDLDKSSLVKVANFEIGIPVNKN